MDTNGAGEHLKELLSRASDNQEKLDRLHAAEIELLQSESLPELLEYLFTEHAMLFQLLSVDLLLIDPEHRIRRLLEETGDLKSYLNSKRSATVKPSS